MYREIDFQCHVLYTHSPHQSPQRIHSFVLVASTRSQFGPSMGNAYTVLYVHKHHAYVTPLKYLLFSKNEDDLFVQPVHLDKKNYHTSHAVSRNAIIFQAETLKFYLRYENVPVKRNLCNLILILLQNQ